MGVLFGMMTITYLKKRIINNCYLLSNKSNYLSIMIMGILISLFFITVPILSEDIYNSIIIPLIIMCWIGTSISFLWLVMYERNNGHVFIGRELE
jgi:predicted membrane protein